MWALVLCWPLLAESQYRNVSNVVLDKTQALGLRTLYEVSGFLNDTQGELEVLGVAKGWLVAGAQARTCRDGQERMSR